MAAPSPSELARKFLSGIKADRLAPIYYVHGVETYLLDHAIDTIVKTALPNGINDFNYELFHGKDVQVEQLYNAVEMLSFMGGKRVVVLRDLQEMDLKQFAAMADYLTNPSPSTCFVVHAVTSQKSIDGRQGVIKKLKKAAEVGEFKAFYERDAEQFLRKQANQRNISLDNDASGYLIGCVGTTLADLNQALDKLDLFLGNSDQMRSVNKDTVSQIIAETRLNDVFELTDAFGDKRLEDALHLLDRLMHMGEPAIKINQMIARHFRILLKLKDPSIRNAGRQERAKAVGVSAYFLKDYQRHSGKFTTPQLKSIMTRLLHVDEALKSSKLSDQTILEHMMIDLIFDQQHA